MKKKSTRVALAAVALLLAGCHAVDAADVAQPTQEPPAEVTPVPAPAEAEPEATPEPTPEPTPAVDMNKTYTLEELYANNIERTILQNYGTLVKTSTVYQDDGEYSQHPLINEYSMDENGYVRRQFWDGEYLSEVDYQDNPYFVTNVTISGWITFNSVEEIEGFTGPLDYLDNPWFGDPTKNLMEYFLPATEVIDSTYPENDMIVVQTHLDLTLGAGDSPEEYYERRTYYVDPATDLVIKVVEVGAGMGIYGGESTATCTMEPGKAISDTTAQVQSVINAENGYLINFSYIDGAILAWTDRPPEDYTFQMRIKPDVKINAKYANGQYFYLTSDGGELGGMPPYHYCVGYDGQSVRIDGGP